MELPEKKEEKYEATFFKADLKEPQNEKCLLILGLK